MEEAHTARLSRTLQELKDYADTLLVIKAKGDRSDQLPAACAAGTALLLRAREQERSAALHAARLKEDSASQRNKLDHDSLQLHNLVYEQQYYDKEIAACRAFASAYTEQQIGSVTLPQQQHEQELQRLTAELQQRQALQQQLQSLQHQKEQLLKERNRVSTSYAELRQQVEHCHSGNSALVSMTQPSRSSIQADAEAAQLLPLPLYIIYTQAAAAAGVVGLPLAVAIEGNPAIAKQQQQQQLSTQPGNDPQAATAAPDSKRRRKQLQQEDQAFQVTTMACFRVMCHTCWWCVGCCSCPTFASVSACVHVYGILCCLSWAPYARIHTYLHTCLLPPGNTHTVLKLLCHFSIHTPGKLVHTDIWPGLVDFLECINNTDLCVQQWRLKLVNSTGLSTAQAGLVEGCPANLLAASPCCVLCLMPCSCILCQCGWTCTPKSQAAVSWSCLSPSPTTHS